MTQRSAHFEPYLRMIEEMNELNRKLARGRPYIHIDPYNTTSHPETVIGLQPGQKLSYDHLGKRHTRARPSCPPPVFPRDFLAR